MADSPLLPPNRKGAAPGADAAQTPAARPLPPARQAIPTAALVQSPTPVAQPYVPLAQIPQAYVPQAPQSYVTPQSFAGGQPHAPYAQPGQAHAAPAWSQEIPEGRLVSVDPAAEPAGPPSEIDPEQVHAELQQLFAASRPWLFLLGLISLFSSFAVIGRVLFMLYVTQGRLLLPMIIGCLVLMLSASISLMASFQLIGYAGKLGEYLRDPTRYWLETALAAQRGVWRFFGALTIVLLLFAVFLVVALLAGALFVTQMMK